MTKVDIRHGDCLEVLRDLPDNSVDSVVCDPPYGLSNTKPGQVADVLAAWVTGDTEVVPAGKGFMGKTWDGFVPPPAVWAECLRVLKPGGHMAVFAGARTQDLMGLSIRLAGFEIRDTCGWIYSQGFPKSMDISKAIDKERDDSADVVAVTSRLAELASAENVTRKDIDAYMGTSDMGGWWLSTLKRRCAIPSVENWAKLRDFIPGAHELDAEVWRLNGRKGAPGEAWESREVTQHATRELVQGDAISFDQRSSKERERRDIPATPDAARWDGWGTALKPAIEPIILARKPLEGTVAQNVLAHGTGGLNIDACRVGSGGHLAWSHPRNMGYHGGSDTEGSVATESPAGRFPANVLLDEHAATEMDQQSGTLTSGSWSGNRRKPKFNGNTYNGGNQYQGEKEPGTVGDSGGASRFFPVFKYQAKAPKKERPVIEREDGSKIQHPTVKPVALMEWLVTLTTPPGGTVLDPFTGTGTTLQAARNKGFRAIGVEQDADYIQLIHARLAAAEDGVLF